LTPKGEGEGPLCKEREVTKSACIAGADNGNYLFMSKELRIRIECVRIILILLIPPVGFNSMSQQIPLSERLCAACHDGKNMLNGNVVIDRVETFRYERVIGAT